MSKLRENLANHNAEAISNQHYFGNNPELNGIACPKCGEELFDSNPMITLTSYPAQKKVHCSKCDYVGYRFV